MQYKIPQDVQIEDKIIGPITMKQLGILAGGGAVTYFFYISLAKSYYWEVWIVPVGLSALITAGIAFVKIANVTFMKFVLLLIEYIFKPRKRHWVKGDGSVYPSVFEPVMVIDKKIEDRKNRKIEDNKKSINKIDEISKLLDDYGKVKI